MALASLFFFFQAEDGIRDVAVTGVQTCALPISIIEDGLVEHSRRLGAKMLAELRRWESELPIVSDVRGRGLLIGLDLVVPGTRKLLDKKATRWIFDTLLSRGVLAMIYNPEVRINPPLVIEEDQAMGALATMKDVLGEAAERFVG